MKTILCYGDSNTWGCPPVRPGQDVARYGPDVRWGSVLRAALGPGYWVVEEGLGGRTTVWDDPIEGEHKNGKRYLLPCLESHAPIDLPSTSTSWWCCARWTTVSRWSGGPVFAGSCAEERDGRYDLWHG